LPLNSNLAAFASFSQNSALNGDEPLLYSLGISASF
ncbi:MAG TPA: autotransporter, partial [Pantoea sp.]|nr:autotransporter [Pantoea sp.]